MRRIGSTADAGGYEPPDPLEFDKHEDSIKVENLFTKEDSRLETGVSGIDRALTDESDSFTRPLMMSSSSYKVKPTLKQRSTEIFECLQSFDINKLILILSKLETEDALELINLVDESGHTLIIRAAYDNTHKISEYLIFFYKTKLAKHLKIKEHLRL